MDETVRWSLTVSQETDRDIRARLGKANRRRGALSQLVERAVQKELFAQTVAAIRKRNANVPLRVIEREIEEAVRAVRASHKRTRRRRPV